MNDLAAPQRVASVDAYRGMVMTLMLDEVLHLDKIARAMPQNSFWRALEYNTSHVAWTGCSLHDLIQPGFTFLVGVSLPFSIASRVASGQSNVTMASHAILRSLILVFLGIFLRSLGSDITSFRFDDTLTQIGLGYFALYCIGRCPPWVSWASLAIILIGYWLAFVLYPLPDESFDYAAVGVPESWPYYFEGFQAHWTKNSNLAWRFDVWFMNLFPRNEPFTYSSGGYTTLSFIPTLGTMLLGLFAGRILRNNAESKRSLVMWLGVAGVLCLATGFAADYFGICPIVKRIWTPSWVLWSGGCCFIWLMVLYLIMDSAGYKKWAFPFMVVGANSIAAYWLSWTAEDFFYDAFTRHIGPVISFFNRSEWIPALAGLAVLISFWLILYWMYRKRVFIRI